MGVASVGFRNFLRGGLAVGSAGNAGRLRVFLGQEAHE